MASVNGTIATDGFPGAATLTVFSVRTAACEEAVDIASPASAMTINARTTRVSEAPAARRRPAGSVEIVMIVMNPCLAPERRDLRLVRRALDGLHRAPPAVAGRCPLSPPE